MSGKIGKAIKWISVGLVVIGLVLGGIGMLLDGMDQVNFFYWI